MNERKTAIWVAVIGGLGVVVAAAITGFFGLLQSSDQATSTALPDSLNAGSRTAAVASTSDDASTSSPGVGSASTSIPTGSIYLSTIKPVESPYAAVVAGPVQLGGHTFAQSIRFTCEGGQSSVVYNVAGYRFLDATIGVPDDATNAAGNIATISFLKNGTSTQLRQPITDVVGQQQPIHLDLQGAAQLDIACTATIGPTGSYISMDIALGNATIGPS